LKNKSNKNLRPLLQDKRP